MSLPALFIGTHEVRILLPDESIFAGYFDNPEAALVAVSKPGEPYSGYTAAWATLNPLRADALTPDTVINPARLVRTYKNATDEHILRREWIMLDFDPKRPDKKQPSTDAEKATAWEQAQECRAELTGMGWPTPLVIDSGNGFHLRYRVNLPNDSASHELVRCSLHSLAERYPLLDVTNHNAARVAKLPGSWARKGNNTDERPHRQSCLLEAGSDLVVSESLLREIAPLAASLRDYGPSQEITSEQAKQHREWLVGYIAHYELSERTRPMRTNDGWKMGVHCPFGEHDEGGASSTVIGVKSGRLFFTCAHDTCQKAGRVTGKATALFKEEMTRLNAVPYLPEPGAVREVDVVINGKAETRRLPSLLEADLADDFLAANKDHALVTDVSPACFASWTGQAWEVRADKRLLSRAVDEHLRMLHGLYTKPEDAKRRNMLKSSKTLNGVVTYAGLHLPEMRQADFDQDEYLLGLPAGLVADLRSGQTREAQRGDYVSRCLTVSPDANHPTPRWTRFLLEVACGDRALADYLRRLAALCLNAHPTHAIFCLHGWGRNGKGSFIRVLEGILGSQARMLRPRELSENKWGDNDQKRTMSTLEGARLVCVNEAKTDSLDFPLLKTLSGGDRLNGAGMRENARQIPPTWKVFLVSNEQPVFPADPAFRGRVHLVPFKADFSQNPEVTIDKTLQAELPGILAELIALSPSVIRDGLPKTGAVREATESLFSELDITARFQADCLEAAPDEAVSLADMRVAAEHWMRVEGLEADLQKFMGELRKRMPKQYGFRTIEGIKTRVYSNVKLRDDSPPVRTGGVVVSA